MLRAVLPGTEALQEADPPIVDAAGRHCTGMAPVPITGVVIAPRGFMVEAAAETVAAAGTAGRALSGLGVRLREAAM